MSFAQQHINWELLESFISQPNYFCQEESFSNSRLESIETTEVSLHQDHFSTSHSDMEVEPRPMQPRMARGMTCPECSNKIKPFQYNEEMTVFMCQDVKVTIFFLFLNNFVMKM